MTEDHQTPTRDRTPRRIGRRNVLAGLASLPVTACAVGAPYVPPRIDIADRFDPATAAAPRQILNDPWWRAFEDPALDRLIAIGLAQNLDIRKAVSRIVQAEGVLAAAGYPVSGPARLSEARISGTSDGDRGSTGFVRAEASWRLALFGELEREREAGRAVLDAAYEDGNVARLTLIGDVASAYIDMRFAQENVRVTRRVIASREQTLDATERLVRDGTARDLDLAQARSSLALARAALPESEIALARAANRILALLGTTDPDLNRQFDRSAPQPLPRSTVVQTGVPADLIRNRPDIRRAERRLAEAAARVGIAQAELYPGLILTGNIALNLSDADSAVSAGFLQAGLDLPIFDRPVREARVETARGVVLERHAEWERTVVLAVEEVRNAIFALDRHAQAVRESTAQLEASTEVLSLVRRDFASGTVDFLQVLDAERSQLGAENARAFDRRNLAIDFVQLNLALGGAYGPFTRRS